MSDDDTPPLVLVSNRGPVTYQPDGSVKRGGGGLVTALTGLASHRDATWIASTMTEDDAEAARQAGDQAVSIEAPDGGSYHVRFVESDPEAYDRFYNIFANPMLWFIQHYLWDQSNAPDIRRHEVEAFEHGYNVVNQDLATVVLDEIDGCEEPVVMVHDYQLYTLPAMVRRARPDCFLHHFIHIPWTQSDAWRVLPAHIRDEIFTGVLANDIVGFHTKSYRRNFLQCCVALMGLQVDMERGVVYTEDRQVWVRAYPLPIDYEATRTLARRDRVAEFESRLLDRRREFSILRVDRADLSKNILRGFTGFDIFLEQHPEYLERITFTAQLMPSRTDVPEYAEYLERIEALVAVVKHRHGTPDWMPIDLKLRDDLEEAVASYKHYDVIMVNAMFDGMNLVAKEAALVNERDGVCVLSENTGAHEELGDFSLTVNPFDVQELADSLHTALTMEAGERRRRAQGLKEILVSRDPGDWVDDQVRDIRRKRRGEDATVVEPGYFSKPNSGEGGETAPDAGAAEAAGDGAGAA
ncbi:MAG: alpha,alpha-trehalose-phosphate synthase (UDP-forming) [Solirubrobacteraceae bacterium]